MEGNWRDYNSRIRTNVQERKEEKIAAIHSVKKIKTRKKFRTYAKHCWRGLFLIIIIFFRLTQDESVEVIKKFEEQISGCKKLYVRNLDESTSICKHYHSLSDEWG